MLEVRPEGRDKGTAIVDFMAEAPFADACRYSSATTSPTSTASPTVTALGGWTVKVGAGTDARDYRLRDVAAVRRWLAGPLLARAPR